MRGREDSDESERALLTEGTALDVDPGDAQHEVAHRLRGPGRQRSWRQERTALSEGRAASPIGEHAEVADADEAVWHDMEEEATEEFVAIEVHDLDAVAVGVVAPAEADTAIGDGDEPLVGDGDTVRVAAEIGEYMFGAGEGRLAVDDPGVLAQLGEPRGPRRRLRESREAAREVQLAAIEGALQASEKPAAEDFGEGADREEEAGPRGNPTRALRRERAPGDDAVDVDVLSEGLPPGVEHSGDTEVTAEMARISTEARQRGRGA